MISTSSGEPKGHRCSYTDGCFSSSARVTLEGQAARNGEAGEILSGAWEQYRREKWNALFQETKIALSNSPLYQYLQDLGHTDFEVCSSVSQKAEQCAAAEIQKERTVHAAQKQSILSKLVEFFRSWFPFPQYKKNDDVLHRLDVGFRFDTLRTILQQEVLLQEDVELIEFLDPSILSAGQCKQQENGQLPTLRSLATPNIWDVSLLLAFVSALLMLPSWWKDSSWPLWAVVLLVYVVFRVWGTWRTAKLQMSLRKYCIQLEETVANSRAFTNLVRKALRLIQETEVISRGFTLVSAACPFNKAGQHPSQHLIGLRKAVYRSVRANFRASRLATLYMLKNYPLNSESDNVTSYICVVPFKELGLGLSEEQVSEEEAHNLTDGFSLPALKVLFQLWVGQSSEFFRRLVLLLSPANASPKPLVSPERLPHHILSDVTQGLPHTHAACLEELKRSYEFYRYFETQHQSGFERAARTKQKSRELNSLQTAVRSLQLHLKALLNEVIILEDELEKLVSSKETPELTTEAHQVLEQKLKFIQPHIQASNSCWEEAISQVEKMSGRNPNKKGKLEVSCDNLQRTTVPLTQPAVYIENKDPIPEEQELEAYVDYSDTENEYKREDFYCFSQEERERQERERQESKRVLQELKSVLGFKASEIERQKWKQLLFSDHAAVKPLSPVEPLKLLNNLESHMNSDTEKQDCSQSCDNSEEKDSNPEVNATDKSRTEYLHEDPEMEKNKGSTTAEGVPTGAGERMCYQHEREVEELKLSDTDGVEVSESPSKDALHSKIKQRLAQLHISTDLNFTSGLAAQVAARSFAFTTMQEETFGDEEEEEEEKTQECKDLEEDCENEDRGSEREGKV
ncbi:vezatin isoform B [Patagioenas fasciata monilis]|uniref:Vezatin n=1 Tax=Patagioenas fasciata monilis TaxID=372326 RepID=A0A1V4KN23_PATFA|nr:vezatin isoform B [Patagioenas fasciata monilis]